MKKKRILIAGLVLLVLGIAGFAVLSQTRMSMVGMMSGSMMGGGMMDDMRQMMGWMSGEEVEVDLSGPRPAENALTVAAGREIYEDRCIACHGEKGDGKGDKADELNTKPRDFTSGLYKFRSTPSGSLPRDEDIYTTISRGLRGTSMLPWFGLTKEEKWEVTYYLKTFTEWFAEEKPEPAIVMPELSAPLTELVKRGRQVYKRAECFTCHGKQGRGDGDRADELEDDWGRPIRPRDFTSEAFKRGARIQDIFLTVATGLDGTPMPSSVDGLPADDILAVATYVNSIAESRPRQRGGMIGMMSMTGDERAGMMIDHPGMPTGMMDNGMMMR